MHFESTFRSHATRSQLILLVNYINEALNYINSDIIYDIVTNCAMLLPHHHSWRCIQSCHVVQSLHYHLCAIYLDIYRYMAVARLTSSRVYLVTEQQLIDGPELFKKYQCPLCGYLLKDAVQPSCGHWLCQSAQTMFLRQTGAV